MRLVDEGAHLVQVEGTVLRPVAGARAGPARGGALDNVGARPDHGAHDRPRLLHAIGDPVGQRGIGRHDALVAGRTDAVTDAAEAAGISRATAYRYFPTQEMLLAEVALFAVGGMAALEGRSDAGSVRLIGQLKS